MINVLVKHRVEDYNKWRPAYDEHAKARKAGGSKGAVVHRDANDPQGVVVITQWEDMAHALAFTQAPELKTAMQKAGVIGMPEIYFLEEIDRQPA